MLLKYWFPLLLMAHTAIAQKKNFVITQFGAISDTTILSTNAIQKTIDTCFAQGGGKVIVPKGHFLSGTLFLKTGVELHIAEGATLWGSKWHKDYKNDNEHAWYGFILANNAHNIAITGKGVIDIQGKALAQDVIRLWLAGTFPNAQKYDESLREKNRPNERFRPQVIIFLNCKKIKIEGITLKNAASWVQTYDHCEDLKVHKIRVESTAYWNNDGIDIVDCKNVTLSNSYFNCADDAICLKSFDRQGGCFNIDIKNCTMRSSASAFKLGTSSYGGFKHIKAQNLIVFDTYRSAIALECVDGGNLEDIEIRHVRAKNTGNAIFIKLGNRLSKIGRLENIRISDVKAEIPSSKPDKGYPMEGPVDTLTYNTLPSSIVGLPQYPIKNVVLKDIHLEYSGGGQPSIAYKSLDSLHTIPEQEKAYPEFQMFGELPAWAFFVRHTEGVIFENVHVQLKEQDYRPAFVFDDVKGLKMSKVDIKGKVGEVKVFCRK